MRTKRIKAANVRIGDVLYGIGTVTVINHLNRTELDIFTDSSEFDYWHLTRQFDDMVEVVVSSTNPAVVLP